MKTITNWIRQHHVLAFFILVYASTWSLILLYIFILNGNPSSGVLIEPLVVFSPALMAMLISGIAEPFPKHESSRPRWIAFLLSWLVSALILILYGWKIYQIDDLIVLLCSEKFPNKRCSVRWGYEPLRAFVSPHNQMDLLNFHIGRRHNDQT
ncbi:MAG: hypothetical protein WBB69_06215 [Anaerolineales bacterium]